MRMPVGLVRIAGVFAAAFSLVWTSAIVVPGKGQTTVECLLEREPISGGA